MASLKELRQVRIDKLTKLKNIGVNPYPADSHRDTTAAAVTTNFVDLEGSNVIIAGRLLALRKHGELAFADLKDDSGSVQLYLRSPNLHSPQYQKGELAFKDLDLLDVGDFVEASGVVTKTQAGEISVEAMSLRLLAKSLRPLPARWDGLKDKEVRMRRRYLDTTMNEDVRQRYIRRAKFWQAHREYFNSKGFYEINIPVLEHIPGGADATPFVTHMDSIDQDFYLRISHELYLKRLIGGGYEKVYEIGPRFRNEGLSDEHLPEHIAMEFYWAYADWEEGMQLIEDLYRYIVTKVYNGRTNFHIRGFDVDFSKNWQRLDFSELMQQKYGLDIHNTTVEEVGSLLQKHNIKGEFKNNLIRGVDNLWKNLRKDIAGPAFLINHPKYLSPLSKSHPDAPHITERFQPIIAGSELGNGWSELNDPLDQLERFQEQQKLRDAGDAEAQWLDIDYVEMLEYGMPPTFGYGHSERVFWFLEDVTAREGVPFPQLKIELEETTKEIYGLGDTYMSSTSAGKPAIPLGNMHRMPNNNGKLPTREEAVKLLDEHVQDEYQKLHSRMIATALEAYAVKSGFDKDLWYLTGLLHDLDYFGHPDEHPNISLQWFKEWGYPSELINAVAAHAHDRTGVAPETDLDYAIIATDELSGLIYAYSLMRPEGWIGMQASSVKKKFKDKSFAAKVDRNEIMIGVDGWPVDLTEHIDFLISVYQQMPDFKK